MQNKLTQKQLAFIDSYMIHGNQTRAYKEAGYKIDGMTEGALWSEASKIARKPMVAQEIRRRQEENRKKSIATAADVMDFFTRAMNGEIKDQFGLEASLSDRIKAGQELAKRTVDIDNKIAGRDDTTISIKIDWARDKEE